MLINYVICKASSQQQANSCSVFGESRVVCGIALCGDSAPALCKGPLCQGHQQVKTQKPHMSFGLVVVLV